MLDPMDRLQDHYERIIEQESSRSKGMSDRIAALEADNERLRKALDGARAGIRYVYHRHQIDDCARESLVETEQEIAAALAPETAPGGESEGK